MKKFSKMVALMLFAGALVLGFASCSNDSSDSGSGSDVTVSATYKYEFGSNWQKIILYSDASVAYARSEAAEAVTDGIIKKGTYEKTGDTFSECTITIKWTQERSDTSPYDWEDEDGDATLTVSGGSGDYFGTTFTLQN
ncbi:hypothetical protein MSI_15520 [Treponema sp. JC4]|uniref:hypothetical protein n=1 Tax=Treponema sp. JC4 TaxID=1124982 RepID=UPI00025B0A9B|nr:hypothetical protein [Treponema sp. JC4]EID84956.1 hypothetical protein MSI_15520 [Treponema sp. JC4]